VGGLLDSTNKVPIIFPDMTENNTAGGWMKIATIGNGDVYNRSCSLMEVMATNYNAGTRLIAFIGISHGISPTPFVVAKGGNGSYKIAIKNNGTTTDIYFYFGYVNSCVEKIWVTKSKKLSITDDDVKSVGSELPGGASEISVS
jgi:hypothetical protein